MTRLFMLSVSVVAIGAAIVAGGTGEGSRVVPITVPAVGDPPAGRTAGVGSPTSRPARFRNSLGMEMVLIPAGEFIMGSKLAPGEVVDRYGGETYWCGDERPRHRVRLTRPFHLAACEVTVGQFRRFVADTGFVTDVEKAEQDTPMHLRSDRWWKPGFEQADDHPVRQSHAHGRQVRIHVSGDALPGERLPLAWHGGQRRGVVQRLARRRLLCALANGQSPWPFIRPLPHRAGRLVGRHGERLPFGVPLLGHANPQVASGNHRVSRGSQHRATASSASSVRPAFVRTRTEPARKVMGSGGFS